MNVNQELDAFREGLPGCEVAALVDLSTTMVLSTSVGARVPQEELDALAMLAQDVLIGPMAEASLNTNSDDAPEALEGLLATHSEARAFLRGGADRNEALVCVCGADADLSQVFATGRETLTSILASS